MPAEGVEPSQSKLRGILSYPSLIPKNPASALNNTPSRTRRVSTGVHIIALKGSKKQQLSRSARDSYHAIITASPRILKMKKNRNPFKHIKSCPRCQGGIGKGSRFFWYRGAGWHLGPPVGIKAYFKCRFCKYSEEKVIDRRRCPC
jgi:hypothetical protein